MVVTALSSTIIFGRARRIDWPVAITLESAAGAGAFFGGLYAHRFSAGLLMAVLGVVVLLAAVTMLRDLGSSGSNVPDKPAPWSWRRDVGGRRYDVNLLVGLPLWLTIGVVGGLTGVGGGFLKVPALVLLFGMPIEIAFGCASFMVMLTAASGLVGHLAASPVDWPTTLMLGALVAVGAQIGPRIALRSDTWRLQHRFAYVLFALAVFIFLLSWNS